MGKTFPIQEMGVKAQNGGSFTVYFLSWSCHLVTPCGSGWLRWVLFIIFKHGDVM
jgi:hypothetical protein